MTPPPLLPLQQQEVPRRCRQRQVDGFEDRVSVKTWPFELHGAERELLDLLVLNEERGQQCGKECGHREQGEQ